MSNIERRFFGSDANCFSSHHRRRLGRAGLAAALMAAETARAVNAAVNITLVDKAIEEEADGNTRWSPEAVEPSFVHDMLEATKFQDEKNYFALLAQKASATVKWLSSFGIEFIPPSQTSLSITQLFSFPARLGPEMHIHPFVRIDESSLIWQLTFKKH